jgi:hypothetical protein
MHRHRTIGHDALVDSFGGEGAVGGTRTVLRWSWVWLTDRLPSSVTSSRKSFYGAKERSRKLCYGRLRSLVEEEVGAGMGSRVQNSFMLDSKDISTTTVMLTFDETQSVFRFRE